MAESIAKFSSFTVLLGGPILFGFLGQPAEAGVSLVAGAIGLAFTNIDKIKRFKGGGFEAEMKEKVDAMVAKESEPDDEASSGGFRVTAFGIDDKTKKVISALNSSQYTWRSVGGVCQESSLTRQDVKTSLDWLEHNGLAVKVGVSKRVNWGLTEQGRDVANSIAKSYKTA